MKVYDLIKDISVKLNSEQEAWWILESITNKSKAKLLSQDISLTSKENNLLEEWINKRIKDSMPLQYLIGYVPFGDLKIQVRPPVLIPRPETEEWCLDLIKRLITPKTVLDLCTGSGCIALLIAKAFPNATVYATDISEEALKLAEENASLNKISNVKFILSDVYNNIPNIKFDLIVANPPYISQEEWRFLSPTITKWEDYKALVSEKSGLEIIERIIQQAKHYLLGDLVLEIGHTQGEAIKKLFEENGFQNIKVYKDAAGKDRLVCGQLLK